MKVDPESRYAEWIQERKRELGALLDFSNADIQSMDDREMATMVFNTRLFEQEASWQSFLFASKDSAWDPQNISRRKKALLGLQDHLKRQLERVISLTGKMDVGTVSKVTGTMVFSAHPVKGRFQLELDQPGGDATPLEKEKIRLDFRLIDLVRVLGLKPGRFKKCLKCAHIFYQSTSKERLYCSPKCSGATRQGRFQKKRQGVRQICGYNFIPWRDIPRSLPNGH
jgi:hypothetical protein